MKPPTVRQLAQRAEKALDALALGAVTNVAKRNVDNVRMGLRALDNEQAELKAAVEHLCLEYVDARGNIQPEELIEELRSLYAVTKRSKRRTTA